MSTNTNTTTPTTATTVTAEQQGSGASSTLAQGQLQSRQLESCAQSDRLCEPTPATSADDASAIEMAGEVLDQVVDVATDPVGAGIDAAGDVATGSVDILLSKAASEMAGTAFGDLASTMASAGQPTILSIGSLNTQLHLAAGFIAFGATVTTLLVAMMMPHRRLGKRLSWTVGALARFFLVSAFGVTVAVAAIDLSNELTLKALHHTVGTEIDTSEANVFSGALATIAVPVVGVMYSFQAWLVGIFVMFWPITAAISITRSFRHALPVMTAAIAANVIWPPLSALAIGKSLSALPNIGAATWWALAAVAIAFITNMFAFAARSPS